MSKKLEVMVIPQLFTEAEKEIARNNIGALSPTVSSIDITDDFEFINGMSTNDVGHSSRLRVIYVPSTDMVQITGIFLALQANLIIPG